MAETQKSAYAAGTIKNLITQWRSFYRFSTKYGFNQWPVAPHTLCLYAQHLAYSFKSAKSVKNYLYGVRTLHVLTKVKPPDFKDIELRLTLRGLTKTLCAPVKQAQPLTPDIMADMLGYLNLNKKKDRIFWAIVVIGFFGMLRKSNLVSDTRDSFNPVDKRTRQIQWGHSDSEGNLG